MACNFKSKSCPECRKRFEYGDVGTHPYFPFCSERCKLLDLGRWLKGEFAITEDIARGNDLKDRSIDLDDPDVRSALEDLK